MLLCIRSEKHPNQVIFYFHTVNSISTNGNLVIFSNIYEHLHLLHTRRSTWYPRKKTQKCLGDVSWLFWRLVFSMASGNVIVSFPNPGSGGYDFAACKIFTLNMHPNPHRKGLQNTEAMAVSGLGLEPVVWIEEGQATYTDLHNGNMQQEKCSSVSRGDFFTFFLTCTN